MIRLFIKSKKYGTKIVKIDDDDHDLIKKHRWYLMPIRGSKQFTVVSQDKHQRTVYMHRLILVAKRTQSVDHKNHKTLDNQKHNLRMANPSQSCMNRRVWQETITGYKGVNITYNNKKHKYKVRISAYGKRVTIGYFNSLIKAAKAYNVAALKYHGEYAKLNPI